jgi:hypothetical protein
MTRRKNVIAALAVAGAVALGSVAGSAPASAQGYAACAPGYYYSNGYCYPDSYDAPFLEPSIGLGFGFGGGFHHFDHGDYFHGGGFHGGGFHGGGFHGGGHR